MWNLKGPYVSKMHRGEGGSQKVKVKLKASVPKSEQGPTAKKWKTVVKKLPALGENILKPKRR